MSKHELNLCSFNVISVNINVVFVPCDHFYWEHVIRERSSKENDILTGELKVLYLK